MARKIRGERRCKNGIQAYVRVNHTLYTKVFPQCSTPEDRARWREEQRQRFGRWPAVAGSFAAKVQEYLAQNQAKKTIKQAERHLGLWLDVLGRDRDPMTITKDEINLVIDGWLKDAGPAPGPRQKGRRPAAKGYAP